MKVKFVVDFVEADEDVFISRNVFSKEECEKIKDEIKKEKPYAEKLTHLLNAYVSKGLEFVSATESFGNRSFVSIFMGPGLWMGCLIFRKIQD